MLTVNDIQDRLQTITAPTDPFLAEISTDPRAGVQKALARWHKNYATQQNKRTAFQARFSIERELWQQGFAHIAGVDEVGRGPLAGPVVSAAVILPDNFEVIDVIDSKQLAASKRDELYEAIVVRALSIGISVIDAPKIDEINIYEASRLAMTEAIAQLSPAPDYILADAMTLHLETPQQSLIKGDARSNSIGAASIIAKVTRDRLMADYAKLYPQYGFEQHAGYGTAQHLKALAEFGVTPLHRRSFKPVLEFL
ncbi:MAG TPA: ribonuclease HII [Lactobacillaceae bacterium]